MDGNVSDEPNTLSQPSFLDLAKMFLEIERVSLELGTGRLQIPLVGRSVIASISVSVVTSQTPSSAVLFRQQTPTTRAKNKNNLRDDMIWFTRTFLPSFSFPSEIQERTNKNKSVIVKKVLYRTVPGF
jgi:hypothetical protein